MICLLFAQWFNDEEKLRKHYVGFRKVDSFNHFFQKLFKSTSKNFKPRKCLRYQDYLSTTKFKAIHNFLKYYDKGKFNQFEEKPIDTIRRGNITNYKVSAQKHREYYKFENSEELVDAFLKNFRSKFNPREKYVVIKCGFSIENLQPGQVENDSPIINT